MNDLRDGSPSFRRCVFCGRAPRAKTNEHVVPQWLMEITGSPGRRVRFEMQPGRFASVSFKRIRFPACHKCNKTFASLEKRAEAVLSKLLRHESLCEREVESLLDWFDKLRVGLWLGGCMLARNWLGINPRFAIAQRMRAVDRLLYIGYTRSPKRGLALGLLTDPVFVLSPSLLGIYVNGFFFCSFSSSGVAGEGLGLPHLRYGRTTLDGECPRAEAQFRKPARKLYGRAFPATASRFSVLAQAITESSLFPLTRPLRKEFMKVGMDPRVPSTVHVFREGVGQEMSSVAQDVLAAPYDSLSDLLEAAADLSGRLRRWVVGRMAEPVAGEAFCVCHFVKQAEQVIPYSTVWVRHRIRQLTETYLKVLWGELDMGEWQAELARSVPCDTSRPLT